MTDPLIRDIQNYLAGDWDTYEIEVIGLLERCLNALAQREEDEAPATPTPEETSLHVGAAVRLAINPHASHPQYVTGVIQRIDSFDAFPYIVDTEDGMTLWRKAEELELIPNNPCAEIPDPPLDPQSLRVGSRVKVTISGREDTGTIIQYVHGMAAPWIIQFDPETLDQMNQITLPCRTHELEAIR